MVDMSEAECNSLIVNVTHIGYESTFGLKRGLFRHINQIG